MGLRKRKLGLALGGGGARGLSHIGVLQSLERKGIPVDLLVGTSIGALVGGAFCCGMGAVELEQRVAEYLESKEFESSAIKAFEAARGKQDLAFHQKIQRFLKNRYYMVQALFRPGLLSQEDFQVTINHFIPDISIEETQIPFRAVATDLISGKRIVFSNGSIRQAIAASCAVPGAVAPLKEGDRLLSDGGIICNIPVSVARNEGADVVIAVSVDRDAGAESECDTVLGVYFRASEIMAYRSGTDGIVEGGYRDPSQCGESPLVQLFPGQGFDQGRRKGGRCQIGRYPILGLRADRFFENASEKGRKGNALSSGPCAERLDFFLARYDFPF